MVRSGRRRFSTLLGVAEHPENLQGRDSMQLSPHSCSPGLPSGKAAGTACPQLLHLSSLILVAVSQVLPWVLQGAILNMKCLLSSKLAS